MSHSLRPLFYLSLVASALIAAGSPLLAADPPAVGRPAPDFRLPSLDGRAVELSKLRARGPVVLVVLRGFPGYQCPACNAQTGGLLAAAEKFRAKNAQIVLVYPGQSAGLTEHAGQFVQDKKLPDHVHLALDPDYRLTEVYGLRWNAPRETAYPSTFVIDAAGTVRFAKVSQTHGGRATVDELLRALDAG